MTKVKHIAGRIIAGILVILLLGVLLIQVPKVQGVIVDNVLEGISSRFDGTLSVGKVKFLPFKTLIIRDAAFIDENPLTDSFFEPQDTIAKIGYAAVSLSLKGLLGKDGKVIDKITVKDATLSMVKEGNHIHNIKRVLRKGTPHPMEDKGDVLLIRKIEARNIRFKLHNADKGYRELPENGINWADLDVVGNAKGHGFHICDACVSATLDRLDLQEKNGYSAWNVSGHAIIHSGNIELDRIHLEDPASCIDIPVLTMVYDNYLSFRDFTHKVNIAGRISETDLDFKTLRSFAPSLRMTPVLRISEASFTGTPDNLKINTLHFVDTSGVSGQINGQINGLMDFGNSHIKAEIGHLDFTTGSLSDFIGEFSPAANVNIGSFAPGELLRLSGKLEGPVSDLTVSGTLNSGIGAMSCGLKVSGLLAEDTPMHIDGRIRTDELDLGRFVNSEMLEECTLGAKVKATLAEGGASLTVDSLGISKLRFRGYDYSGLTAAGTFSNREFNGRIVSSDPNLNFMMQGVFNLSKKTNNALYNFVFSLGYADLNALHLDSRGTSKVSLLGKANFMRVVKGDLIGNIAIKDVMLENNEGRHSIGDIDVNSYSNNGDYRINFTSSFAEGDYTGTRPVTAVIDAIKETTLRKELPSLAGSMARIWENDRYAANVRIYDAGDLLSFVKPGLYIAEGTTFKMDIDKEGTFATVLKSQRLALRDKYLKDLTLSVNDPGNALSLAMNSSELNFSNLKFHENKLSIGADEDHAELSYTFDNGKDTGTDGSFHFAFDFARDEGDSLLARMTMLPSAFSVEGGEWEMHPATLTLNRGVLNVDSVRLNNGSQLLSADGAVSRDNQDTLRIRLDKFDIGTLSPLLGEDDLIAGSATGQAVIISPVKEKIGLLANLRCDSTRVNGFDAGMVKFGTSWEDENQRLAFRLANDIDGKTSISSYGTFSTEDRSIDAKIRLTDAELGYAGNLLKSIFSEMSGKASGDISVNGPLANPSIKSSDARFEDATLRVAYTNVPYFLSGPFHINDNGVVFDDLALRDRKNGTGTVSGGISFDHLRDIRMATDIKVNGIEAFNTGMDENRPVYGNVNASGSVSIKGPFSALVMEINASTTGGGNFHIPLKSESSAKGTDILTFKQAEVVGWVDPYEEMIKRLAEVEKERKTFGIKMRIGIRPELTCSLDLGSMSGSSLTGHGRGTVNMDLGEGKDFNINGDYTLSDGKFKFSAMGIANREFSISSGSSIKFNGDIMESDLSLDAIYSTKASLATLIADTTSVSSRRTVECGLNISEKLKNPRLGFNINIPDLDPTTKSMVENALNTDDKLQKQFLALLVTNSFLPSDQSGIVNNTDMLFSNVSEIMAGQLNNILQRLEIPLDLGLKYQPNEGGTDIFDVALSTQLFNNRVSVNGNIGNRQYMSGSQQDVVGDLDIDMKLDKAGAVRLSMFSHSADQYTNYLDYSQRNGVGVSYQKEFNTWKGFFRELFSSKKAREQRILEMTNDERVTVNIQSPDKK